MKNARVSGRILAGLAVVSSWLIAAQLSAAPSQQWTATGGDVRVLCPLTIGGSFEARTTSLTGVLAVEPGATALAGLLRVDLTTLDTGISLRNRHMLETYLEVYKGGDFETAALSNIDVGALGPGLTDARRPFTARLQLHGTTHAVTGAAKLNVHGSVVRVDASFPVRISDFGIAEPRHLGVGVKDEVAVHVVFLANPVADEDTARLRDPVP